MPKENLKRDMLWNAGGNLAYLFAQWLVTVLVARFFQDNYASAGVLSIAMSLSAIFQTVAFFGIRNYQVSDIRKKHADEAYFTFRHFSAAASLLFALVCALLMQYRGETLLAILLYMLFRIVESYSDVLHGIAQREGRLDIAGRGFTLKAIAILFGFFVGFFLTKRLAPSLLGMLIASFLTTVLYDLTVVRKLSRFPFRTSTKKALALAGETLPLCIYFFLLSSISSLPKFVLEKTVGGEALGAYASIFAPALLIAGVAGYLYTPFIATFATFAEEGREKNFRRLVGKLILVLLLLLLLLFFAAHFLGEWALVLVFGETIRPYAGLLFPILGAVFATATLSFFCMLAVVRRRFLPLCIATAVGALISLGAAFPLIRFFGADGASYALLAAAFTAVLLLCFPVFRKGIKNKETKERDSSMTLHTFALCAYKESAYLEDCVKSLLAQTVKSEIFISTATPCPHIQGIAEKYGLPLYINHGEAGITGDWNFAVSHVNTPYFTIAHQDDIYDPTYTEAVLESLSKGKGILAFTDYYELRDGIRTEKGGVMRVKRLLASPLKLFRGSVFVRRRMLSLGNAICCPSVTYVTEHMKDFSFDKKYAFVCDWDAFERLSRHKGRFYRIPQKLMGHRIHEESATTALTASPRRAAEETEMFDRFWPHFITKLIFKFYQKSADSNDLDQDKTKSQKE